jgi:hypothetical protein
MKDCIDNFANHIFRSILAVEAIAYRVKRKDIAARAIKLSCALAEDTECLDEEGITGLKTRLSLVSSSETATVE